MKGWRNQPSEPRLSTEAVSAVEDKITVLVDSLTDLEQATLYTYLYHAGMSLQRAHEIRVKAGAVN